MANETTSSNLFNPMMLWADMGLRALEMSVSSTQNMGDSLDRVARAGASAEVTDSIVSDPPTGEESARAASSGLALATSMQRSTYELMTQNWLQWMSALGSVASLAAGGKGAGEALRWGLQPAGGLTATPAQPGSSTRPQGGSRESHAETASKEHALASAGPQRRRSTGRAKRKPRARNG